MRTCKTFITSVVFSTFACITLLSSSAFADVANLNPTDDATIRQDQPALNLGANPLLQVRSALVGMPPPDNWRSLLKFSLSSIPAGSTINSATLTLFLQTAPGVTRNHEVHFSSNDAWSEGAVTFATAPALTSLLDTIATGIATGSKSWGEGGPNPVTEGLSARVALEFAGDQVITLQIKDSVDDSAMPRIGEYTSKEGASNPIPVLSVDYTPPAPCTEATIEIEAFNLTGPGPIDIGEFACFDVEYKITAGCKALSFVKTQGGTGGNLITQNIQVTKGSFTTSVKGRGNTVITWKIDSGDGGLAAGESQSLTATICTGVNPAGKQEFTSCGLKPITGEWSSEAVVTEDSSIIQSTPDHTDRLEVEVTCP